MSSVGGKLPNAAQQRSAYSRVKAACRQPKPQKMVAESTYCKKSAQSFRFFCNFALKKLSPRHQLMYHIFRTLIISTLLLSGAGAQPAAAQLTDRTLRIDYQFSGNKQQQHIAVSELLSNKGWADVPCISQSALKR